MSRTRLNILRIGVILAAAAMIAFGISRGELSVVLNKAIDLCFECVGLG